MFKHVLLIFTLVQLNYIDVVPIVCVCVCEDKYINCVYVFPPQQQGADGGSDANI